jgi:putative endonuclease
MKQYYVYILSNLTKRLYIGITNNLERRMYEQKNKLADGFTSKYNLTRLVYFEDYKYVLDAIAREKQLKGWLRERKVALIESQNPNWDDLSEFWFPVITDSSTASEYGPRSE